MLTMFVIISWKYFGFHMILMLAGLQGIPRELEEAALIDGADTRQAFRYVTLPLLGPDDPRLGLPVDHRRAPAVRHGLGHDRRRPAQRLEHDGDLRCSRPGSSAPRWATAAALAVILFLFSLVVALRTSGSCCGATPRARSPRTVADPMATTTGTSVSAAADARRRTGLRVARPSLLGIVAYVVLRRRRRGDPRSRSATRSSAVSRPTASWRPTPARSCPTRGSSRTTTDVLVGKSAPTFWGEFGNSLVIAVISVTIAVVFASMAAFVFARMQFRGREALFTLFVFGLLFPTAVAILPLFILVRQLGLSGNPLGVALPQAAFALPLTIVILRPFFRSIPAELEDAARIDGCSSFGFFWRVLLPLGPARAGDGQRARRRRRPGTPSCCRWSCSTARTSGRCRWALRTSRPSTRPTRRASSPSPWSAIIPAIIFYAIAERQLVGGLTSGAVKG